jgi:hypothetical protein
MCGEAKSKITNHKSKTPGGGREIGGDGGCAAE